MRRTEWRGLPIVIENEPGSLRPWSGGQTVMRYPYGYFADHQGSDGDELDCYLGPDADAASVYVVHQLLGPDFKRHDEDKVMLDFATADLARAAYLQHRDDGDRAFGGMTEMPVDRFLAKLRRRTGDGKIRHSIMGATFTVPAFRFKLATDATAFDASDPVAVVERLKSAIGKWSRGMTMGYKARADIEFTAALLSSLIGVVRQRGDRVSICQDHKSAFVATTGQPAPSLGYFYGLAVFDVGKLVDHWAFDGGSPPEATDENGEPRNGLYCRLGEITPLGFDLKEGFANYSGLSPTFELNTQVESGEKVPIFLIDFGATSAGYQGGCALNFHALSAPAAPITSAAPGGKGAIKMAADARYKTGEKIQEGDECRGDGGRIAKVIEIHGGTIKIKYDNGDTDYFAPSGLSFLERANGRLYAANTGAARRLNKGATKMATQKFASLYDYDSGKLIRNATAQEEAASIEAAKHDSGAGVIKVDGKDCYVMSAKRFSGAMDEAQMAAHFDFAPDDDAEKKLAKVMAKCMAEGAPIGEPEAMAAAVPDEEEKKEEEAMGALKMSLIAKGVKVPANASRAVLMSLAAMQSGNSDDARIAALVDRRMAEKDAADKIANEKAERAQLVTMARAAKAPEHEIQALGLLPLNLARDQAQKYGALPGVPSNLFSRLTASGTPIGVNSRTESTPSAPRVVTMGGMTVVENDAALADKAREMAESKDPVIMSRVNARLHASEQGNPFRRLIMAQQVAAEMHPELVPQPAR